MHPLYQLIFAGIFTGIFATGSLFSGIYAKDKYYELKDLKAIKKNVSYQKLAIFQIEVDKGIYQIGVVIKLFSLGSKPYSIDGIAFKEIEYHQTPKVGGIMKKIFFRKTEGEAIEDNIIEAGKKNFYKILMPYKFEVDLLGLYDGINVAPFHITIFGKWELILKNTKILIKPDYYANSDSALSLQEWESLLKPISKIDVENLNYKRMPIRIPKTENALYYLIYNRDRSATIDIFEFSQVPPVKSDAGVMTFIVGQGIPKFTDGWKLLGHTYAEAWSNPQKLAIYNSIHPPDKKGNPREFGWFQGARAIMRGE